jgi:hypothetical protein
MMILELNKTELVVLKDVFGKRVSKLGLGPKTELTRKNAKDLYKMIADEFDSGYVQGDEADVLNDVLDKVA